MSEVYLAHLFAPVCDTRPARHYLGFAENTVKREENYRKHKAYFHSRLMYAAVERGIDFVIARVWKDCTKRDEKLLRDLHANPRLCPICTPSLELVTRLNSAGRYQTYPIRDPKRVRYGDLATLRDRVLRPARPRVRSDGTSNTPKIEYIAPEYADEVQPYAIEFNNAIFRHMQPPIENDHAPYGFDADIAF